MQEIPNKANCFSTLGAELPLRKIAALYRAAGWEVRASGWTEYEIRSDWAELTLADSPPILLWGAVVDLPSRLDDVFAPLVDAGVSFTVDPI